MPVRKSSKPSGRTPKTDPLKRARRSLAAMRDRLRDAEATLDAIRSGAVDALVVQGAVEDQVFMLRGADRRYRQLVETMNEGALLIAASGLIVYGNRRFAALIGTPLERVFGPPPRQYFPDIWQRTLDAVLRGGAGSACHAEAEITTRDGERLRVY